MANNIRIGIAGLGRLGYRHAENIAFKTPGAELAAVCSVIERELARAAADFHARHGLYRLRHAADR